MVPLHPIYSRSDTLFPYTTCSPSEVCRPVQRVVPTPALGRDGIAGSDERRHQTEALLLRGSGAEPGLALDLGPAELRRIRRPEDLRARHLQAGVSSCGKIGRANV